MRRVPFGRVPASHYSFQDVLQTCKLLMCQIRPVWQRCQKKYACGLRPCSNIADESSKEPGRKDARAKERTFGHRSFITRDSCGLICRLPLCGVRLFSRGGVGSPNGGLLRLCCFRVHRHNSARSAPFSRSVYVLVLSIAAVTFSLCFRFRELRQVVVVHIILSRIVRASTSEHSFQASALSQGCANLRLRAITA